MLSHKDPLEEEMATHSSILAWRIPWTEDPGEPQSMGSQRVRHERAHIQHTYQEKRKVSLKIYRDSRGIRMASPRKILCMSLT